MSLAGTPPPPELKPITPYLARAKELQAVEPVISYWCAYYALQQALSLGVKEKASNMFLMEMMDGLEASKTELGMNEAITDDVAASAYVENFAVKLFDQADDEDRKGKSTKLTAKKFLAAANFHEILATFGELSSENREKIKYAKWKASDIAKAFREGRKPTPGPAGGLPPVEDDGLRGEVTSEEAKELAQELAALGTTDERQSAIVSDPDVGPAQSTRSATAPSTLTEDPDSYPFPQHPTTPLPSAPPAAIIDYFEGAAIPSAPTAPSLSTFLDAPSDQGHSSVDLGPMTRSIPITHQTSDLPPPAPAPAPPSLPPPPFTPSSQAASSRPSTSTPTPTSGVGFPSAVFPTAPPAGPQAPAQPTPPTRAPGSMPISTPTHVSATPSVADALDPMTITQIQKHAKWAISALNYEDVETARKELRIALGMLGG
ncbi:BQ2448_3831 [Microbotryum intermedium]|uniref:BQ2448_3831 protein n=1 Tax=Microbotryum intermedium TaxID=269621 RepID=A0A238FE47_9BASI|nr:BQ2448_3831 [Microbotryum intermedium]